MMPSSFNEEIQDLVMANVPRRFAVVAEWVDEDGERNAAVAGWGLADPDDGGAVLLGTGERRVVFSDSAERAAGMVRRLARGPVSVRWVDAEPV
ncbi:hypothetical protein [Streptomyces mayteni]